MKYVNRFFSVFLLLALICSLSGCIDSQSPTDTEYESEVESDTETIHTEALTQEVTQAQTEPIPEKSVRLSFIGMGDNLIHSNIYKQSKKSDGTYDFLPKYKDVRNVISNADIAFINQETPMCGEKYGYSNYPQFNTPNQMGLDLVTMGFDVIAFANNHMYDKGSNAFSDMIDFTDTLDALVVGLYRDAEDYENIRILEKDGVKIAFLAYTYGTNIRASSGDIIPCYKGNKDVLERQITNAKKLSDFVVVSIHWGKENRHTVSDEQSEYAQLISDCGADVILGHHPHVIQKVEWLDGKDGNKTLCYYSLGNGINSQDYLKNMVGITASFDFVVEGNKKSIENASVIPTFSYQSRRYGNVELLLLENFTSSQAKKHHCNDTDQTVTVEKARKIITDNIAKEFLPDYLITEE